MSNRDTYSVESVNGAFTLQLNGQLLSTFKEQEQAERAARALARMSERCGRTAEIRISIEFTADTQPAVTRHSCR
jgi:hypothetical protein